MTDPIRTGEEVERRRSAAAQSDEDARRGLDRLVFFSDAVIAIAITLVVLPLVDVAREPNAGPTTEFFADNSAALIAAGISFVVIGSFWREHHRIFNHAIGFTPLLVTINLLWLAGIAFLPLATVLQVDAAHDDRLATFLYIGTVGVTMALLRVEELVLTRSHLFPPGSVPTRRELVLHWSPVALTALAAAVAALAPQLGLYPLLLLVLSAPIHHISDWRARQLHPAP